METVSKSSSKGESTIKPERLASFPSVSDPMEGERSQVRQPPQSRNDPSPSSPSQRMSGRREPIGRPAVPSHRAKGNQFLTRIRQSIYRTLTPTPTIGSAPSHSPPDVRYLPGLRLGRFLGWFGIGLGIAKVVAPRLLADVTRVQRPGLIRLCGLREIVCGMGILGTPKPAWWLWGRVGGDALDLAALGAALIGGADRNRRRALISAIAVAGITALDLVAVTQLHAASAMKRAASERQGRLVLPARTPLKTKG